MLYCFYDVLPIPLFSQFHNDVISVDPRVVSHIYPRLLFSSFSHHTQKMLEESDISFVCLTPFLVNKSSRNMEVLFRKETTN